jgi:hypothetical protein
MSDTLNSVIELVSRNEIRISAHGYRELAADDIFVRDLIQHVGEALLIEDYPDFHKGPAVLVLHYDSEGDPIHVVWGIPIGETKPAVLVTAYRPDPSRWSSDFTRRR